MARKISKTMQKRIIDLLKENPGVPTSRKEISHTLGIHKNDYHIFLNSIVALSKSGKLTHVRKGHYAYPQKTNRLTGELRTTRAGYGFVMVDDQEVDIFIAEPNLNTAFDRDIVQVQLYASSRRKRLEGFVTKIVKRFRSHIVGTYHKTEYYSYVTPDDPKIYRDIIVPPDQALHAQDGQKVLVEFERWERSQHNPEGHIVEVLGNPGEKGVDIASIVYSYNLQVKFPAETESAAKNVSKLISKEELAGREDLRKLVCFTIDPEDARDFDDAVSLTRLENGHLELGVHIADVSHYVPQGSAIDKEAFKRGTSIYLVDRVIPMLPEYLSNEVCSLNPREDRLTFSCFMELDENGEVTDYRIVESVINSNQRFTYEQVQDILDGKAKHKLAPVLKEMDGLRALLMRKRFEKGGIDFETPEVRFVLDEQGQPVKIVPKKRLNAHRLVEEFMLMANQTVARHIKEISPKKSDLLPFIYRIHEKPSEQKMENFFNFLMAIDVPFTPVKNMTSRYFQNILDTIKGGPEELVITEVALRSMMKAVYSTKNVGHFGLGFKDYTHFTSPIRRYPDLTVHRMLKRYNQSGAVAPKGLTKELDRIADQSSRMERLAVEAERESIKLKQTEFIQHHIGETFKGVVSGVMAFGVFVELEETFVEGLIRVEKLDDDFYIYDEKSYSLIGRDSEQMIRLADEVEIRVESVDLEKKAVDFSLVQNFTDHAGRRPQKRTAPKKRRRRRR